jgi:putative membrane protein
LVYCRRACNREGGTSRAELQRRSPLIFERTGGQDRFWKIDLVVISVPDAVLQRSLKGSTMKYLAFGLALGFLAAPAMAQSLGEKSGVNSALGISPTTADFVKEAATSDMFEIQSSQIAQERGNAAEKSFAATMIRDHQKTTDELKSMLASGDLKADLPTGLDTSHQSEIDKLRSLSGADFSSRYDKDQVSGHKDAVSLFERYSASGDEPKLKDWAGQTLPTLRHRLEMAQELETDKTVGTSR